MKVSTDESDLNWSFHVFIREGLQEPLGSQQGCLELAQMSLLQILERDEDI